MYFAPLRLIKKDADTKTLAAFLKDDQYGIQNHNSSSNLLIFKKKPSEKQQTLFTIWFSSNQADMFN
jgi:hypothetical protein